MRSLRLSVATLLVLVGTSSASAQLLESHRAFEPSASLWIGPTVFGPRVSVGGQDYSYSSSVSLGARAERSVTRRVGLLGDVSISPLSKISQRSSISRSDSSTAVVYRANAALGWRFKPSAPVFFFAGGGMVGANRRAGPTGGSSTDPEVTYGLGYDGGTQNRWSFRAVYQGYVVFPSAPPATADGSARAVARSTTHDFSIQLGARYSFSRR
ncbi:MAG: outer membrane beta-barrel protein [Gemmatimonadota bacterium]|nr:outer membrane beta-barrel protein [Gemmatimonadota bacterium]